MRMIRLAAPLLFGALLFCHGAPAQTPGGFTPHTTLTATGLNDALAAKADAAALAAKVDASGGVVTNFTSAGKTNLNFSTTSQSPGDGWLLSAASTLNYPASGAWADRIWRSTATLTGNSSGIWQPNFFDCVTNGAFIQSAESNCIHPQTTLASGFTLSGASETIETSLINNGTITAGPGLWVGALAQITQNTGTIGSAYGFYWRYHNDNVAANSIGTVVGLECDANFGPGTVAQFPYCLRNTDSTALIATAGNIEIGSVGPDQGFRLYIKGKDTSAGTFNTVVQDSAGANLFSINDAGGIAVPNYLSIGVTSAVPGTPFYIKGPNTSGGTFPVVVQNSAGTALFSVADDGSVSIGQGTAAFGGAGIGALLTLNGATSGAVNFKAAAVAGSNTITLPAQTGTVGLVLTGTTGSIGGGALAAGACASGTATVTGVSSAMGLKASPVAQPQADSTHGVSIWAFMSAADTVTVNVCALVATTPNATAYNIRAAL